MYPITYEEARNGVHADVADNADNAVNEELENMERYQVWTTVKHDSLTEEELKIIVPSGLYLKYKTERLHQVQGALARRRTPPADQPLW